jgi:hypothetical protein
MAVEKFKQTLESVRNFIKEEEAAVKEGRIKDFSIQTAIIKESGALDLDWSYTPKYKTTRIKDTITLRL